MELMSQFIDMSIHKGELIICWLNINWLFGSREILRDSFRLILILEISYSRSLMETISDAFSKKVTDDLLNCI